MVTKQVSVRLVAVGGKQVKTELMEVGREGSRAFNQLDRGARGSSVGLQNFGYQVQDFAVQVAGGTSATRAMSQQLPQLLSGFGLWGVALGTVSAILIPLVGYLFNAADATASWTDELSLTSGTISGVEGAVTALKGVQEQYNAAISASGGASSAASALVIANSAKEFEARKAILGVELELLRIRGQEQASSATNLSDSIRAQAEAAAGSRTMLQDPLMSMTDASGRSLGDYVNLGPRSSAEAGLGAEFESSVQRDQLALRKLNAELTLTNLTVTETEKLMGSTFDTIAGGGGASAGAAPAASGGGGGGGGAGRATAAIATVRQETEQLSGAAKQLEGAFKSTFVDVVTGAKSAQDAVASLLADLAKMLANEAFESLVSGIGGGKGGGIFGSIKKALGFANGGAFAGGRLTAFAGGGVVGGPTLFPMANGAGLMGEAGPEGILPLTRINGKLGVSAKGGGAVTVNINMPIDARGAVEGVAAQVAAQMQAALPAIARVARAAVADAQQRGKAA